MSSKVSLRVKCEGGQGVVRGLDSEDSLEKLISHSLETLGKEDCQQNIKLLSGFPPKPLDISDRDKSISSVGIRSGDTIIFQVSNNSSTSSTTSSTPSAPPVKQSHHQSEGETSSKRLKTENNARLERKVVPADNSCLFTSINYCMSGLVVESQHSRFMREVIASVVSEDREKYSDAILGRSNDDYCR